MRVKRKRHKTGGQALGQAVGQGSGKPRKAGGEERDRREVWPGEERLRDEPDKGKAQDTSQSLIASIILVLNLAGEVLLCLDFSARETLNDPQWLLEKIEPKTSSDLILDWF